MIKAHDYIPLQNMPHLSKRNVVGTKKYLTPSTPAQGSFRERRSTFEPRIWKELEDW